MIHSEFMTHRVISRNAGSSRAIPVAKLIAEVRDDATRASPVYWGAEQKGMQSGAELSDTEPAFPTDVNSALDSAKWLWKEAAHQACRYAEYMVKLGVHKSIVNRLLEPFSHINVVATATEWDNFFGLRLDKAAQPEMRVLAEAMWAARQASEPKLLKPGEWHLPYVDDETRDHLFNPIKQFDEGDFTGSLEDLMIRMSVARCARVSYSSFETQKRSTVDEDLALYDKLLSAQPLHASPAEHQATPDVFHPESYTITTPQELTDAQRAAREMPVSVTMNGSWGHQSEHGNFIGWCQYRKMLPGESCAPLPEGYR